MLCGIILKTDRGEAALGGNLVDLGDVRRNFKRAGVGFLQAELGLSVAFAQLAIGASNPERIERHKENALKGYQTIFHFLDELPLDAKDVAAIREGLVDLRSLHTRLHVI